MNKTLENGSADCDSKKYWLFFSPNISGVETGSVDLEVKE